MSEQNNSTELATVDESLIPTSLDVFNKPTHSASSAPESRHIPVPYVAFRGKKSTKNVEALDAAGVKVDKNGNGMFYLMDRGEPLLTAAQKAGGPAILLHVFQFARFYTLTDDDGKILDTYTETSDGLFSEGVREHIFAVVAVVNEPGKFTAATLQLQSAQCAALRPIINLLGEKVPGPLMDREKWGSRSTAHKKSAVIDVPGGRARTMIWSTLEKPKTGTGQPYNEGHGTVAPTPEGEIDAFTAWTKDKAGLASILLATGKYNWYVKQARSKLREDVVAE